MQNLDPLLQALTVAVSGGMIVIIAVRVSRYWHKHRGRRRQKVWIAF